MASVNTPNRILEIIEHLPQSDDVISDLQQLKIAVSNTSNGCLKDIVNNTSLNSLYELLDSQNSEQVELCCQVLSHLMSSVDASVILVQYQNVLSDGLNHNAPSVRLLCIHQLQRVCDDAIQQISSYKDILNKVINLLGDDVLLVAKEVNKLLKQWCGSRETLDMLLSGPVFETMNSLMQKSDTIRYRVYELIVDLANGSESAMQQCQASGVLDLLINEIYKDDLLVQLNCLDQLTDIAMTEHGLQFLIKQGIVLKLEQMLEILETDPMVSFLLPGLIKFFGNMARLHPKEMFDQYDLFLKTVFSVLDSSDVSLSIVAIETVGFVGRTVEGKKALEDHGVNTSVAVRRLGALMRNSPQEIRGRCITSIANLIHLEFEEQTPHLLSLTESWFNQIQKPMEFVVSMTTQPFEDLRAPLLTLIRSLASLPWGQRRINEHPGFNEYLLNRSTEFDKRGKEMKYAIVRTLVDSPTAQEIFGNPFYLRLREYANEGAFYVRAETQVALEST
ncbi:26S proteasome non-ATPase regulatory subunit 5-like [Tubulanus polymorphus]|uniref:26S proteasome non-ATPase regulatory subunit 5-like n=1 Tax=Tubulanus polymorphus TaxID=672921 RepID=UPI003DA63564